MDWVEFTGETLDEAKDRALDALGVGRDEAEFEVVEEPSKRLLGLVKREARVRARVRPTAVRPKQDRRRRNGKRGAKRGKDGSSRRGDDGNRPAASGDAPAATAGGARDERPADTSSGSGRNGRGRTRSGGRSAATASGDAGAESRSQQKEQEMSDDQMPEVSPEEVRDAAVEFMEGLTDAFGVEASTTASVDGTEIEVTTSGGELGLLVGPGGRTLTAVQDLARVASQRRLGDHDTRLRIDVGGYREKRRAALESFTRSVAEQVMDSGTAKALEPMASADRKVVHDVLNEIDGVTSRSEGDDPRRRVVIEPA